MGLGWLALRQERPWLMAVAWWLLAIKPPNVLLVILLYLWSMRRWRARQWLSAVSLTVLSLLASSLLLGWDWPRRYLDNMRAEPPLTFLISSVWRGAEQLGVRQWPLLVLGMLALGGWLALVRREGLSERSLSLGLAVNLLFSPYTLSYHYILLLPTFLYVARRDWRWALLAYLTTWTPFLRLLGGFDITWVDSSYPLALLVGAWWVGRRGREDA